MEPDFDTHVLSMTDFDETRNKNQIASSNFLIFQVAFK
jgi:hypothetical protein